MVEAVLVDVDGTLIDNNQLHVLAWLRSFRRVGREIDANSIVHRIGMGSDKLPTDVLGEDEAEIAEKVGKYHGEEYQDKGLINLFEPLPRAKDLLVALREKGVRVALASSGEEAEVARYLEQLGGEEAADVIVTSGDVSGSKPDPDIFGTALEKLGHPASAVVIGDTVYDVQAASKLGLPCVSVLTGGIERELLVEAGAAAVYQDAAELIEHLDEVLSPPELSEVALGAS